MKKILLSLGGGLAVFAFVFSASVAFAAKPDKCATIQGGTIADTDGNMITTGYDQWGYNYQGHLFNGMYCDSYRDAAWCQPYADVKLSMKWNDAWISNKDCNGDGKLDRHFGFPSYIGSGAWLTNHQSGEYEGSNFVFGSLTGDFKISFVLSGTYEHDVFLTNTNGVLTGNGGYPVDGPYSYTWDITSGSVAGDTISFDAVYTGGPDAIGTIMHVTGTIQTDGTVVGEWDDNYLNGYREGTWSSVGMTVPENCDWNYFVKIVAKPDVEYSCEDNGGEEIWGEFCTVMEVENDACAGLHGVQTKANRPGLGNW